MWFIALKRDDMVLIQMFQNNIAELSLKSIFFNEDVMKEPELMSLLKSSEKTLRFVEILNLRDAEELEEYRKWHKEWLVYSSQLMVPIREY